jgi:hypothetical protein
MRKLNAIEMAEVSGGDNPGMGPYDPPPPPWYHGYNWDNWFGLLGPAVPPEKPVAPRRFN